MTTAVKGGSLKGDAQKGAPLKGELLEITSPTAPPIEAQLIRSKARKSLGLIVRDGKVTVRAPARASLKSIRTFAQQKHEWILKHLEQQQTLKRAHTKSFTQGELHYWLGKRYPLDIKQGRPHAGHLVDNRIEITCANPGSPASVKRALEAAYKKAATQRIEARVNFFKTPLNVAPVSIKCRYYKSRWGSCNHRHGLQFNWLLIMAPPEVIDYVVVHELCHIQHFNHSNAFWQRVASACPDFATHKQWLNQQNYLFWPQHD